jgi:hypothetical protein
MMRSWGIAASALLFCSVARAADPVADATARLLAGLPPRDDALAQIATDRAWLMHAADMDKAWARLERDQLKKIREWAPQFLGDAYTDEAPVFYMFSGPDFLYANAFFPRARTYILCGIEPIGSLPDLEQMPALEFATALGNLRRSVESLFNWSFFITKQMKTDLGQKELQGTLPLLSVFLARAGCTIEAIGTVALDDSGEFVPAGKGTTPGVRIDFTSAKGESQTLYYFMSNLADYAIAQRPGFLAFCERQGQGSTLLKAASFLMHVPGFTRVREFLLARSRIIVQDDSGIPHRFFNPEEWRLRYFGRYTGPVDTFKEHPQPDLARAFAAVVPAPLPFSFGYNWQPSRSSMIVAVPL